ncbi:hypothetical protein B0J12DRAFT_150441 [Macrophomina phaseolina]|uniref:Uncharacterized protein n=1 Tax=Macrophomina phaseolina TaxID=35725 RepID=A0ABQ8G6G9_9PEZI|nr:hypothetical protein B0J12DRAFT_150441 [Macrophomina phaseolina]
MGGVVQDGRQETAGAGCGAVVIATGVNDGERRTRHVMSWRARATAAAQRSLTAPSRRISYPATPRPACRCRLPQHLAQHLHRHLALLSVRHGLLGKRAFISRISIEPRAHPCWRVARAPPTPVSCQRHCPNLCSSTPHLPPAARLRAACPGAPDFAPVSPVYPGPALTLPLNQPAASRTAHAPPSFTPAVLTSALRCRLRALPIGPLPDPAGNPCCPAPCAIVCTDLLRITPACSRASAASSWW